MLRKNRRSLFLLCILAFLLAYLYLFDVFSISSKRVHVRLFGIEVNKYFAQELRNDWEFELKSPKTSKFNFLSKYPFYMQCRSNLTGWATEVSADEIKRGYLDSETYHPKREKSHTQMATGQKTAERITRAMVFYFPLDKLSYYEVEFRWLYASWIEMQKYEPSKWRTDLLLFADTDTDFYREIKKNCTLTRLNCTLENRRRSPSDEPMCSLIPYKPLKSRQVHSFNTYDNIKQKYQFLLSDVDIFSDDPSNLRPFYSFLKESRDYEYLESILVAFDGYQYFKRAGYDFVLRSDMDIFLTPLFAKWVPRNCNDFYVGGGGFSQRFYSMRLARVARELGMYNEGVEDL